MRDDPTSRVRTSQALLGSVGRAIGVAVRAGVFTVGVTRGRLVVVDAIFVGVLASVGGGKAVSASVGDGASG